MSDETEDNNPLNKWLKEHGKEWSAKSGDVSPKPSCGSCRFSATTPQLNQLKCTRYPPQIMLMPPNQFVTEFPIVKPNQLCGEWQPK